VVVVDNGSTDGSLAGIDALDLPLVVIRNGANRGFGPACNQGAREGCADYVLLLNPDTRLEPGSLAVPIDHLERRENARVGAVGIRLVDDRGATSCSAARFPSATTYLWIATGLDRVLRRARLGYRMSEWDHGETRDVDHVMGAFYLVRRAAFDAVGGFDEDFFVYFEDLDLSRRIADAGWGVRFLADAAAWHKGGGTTSAVRARRLGYFVRGKLRYARKHHGPAAFALAAAATFALEPLTRLLGALARGRAREAAAVIGGFALCPFAEPPRGAAPAAGHEAAVHERADGRKAHA
jgi:hypothetical protein